MALLVDKPRFLSMTLTATDPAASLLLEQRLLPRFTDDPSTTLSHHNDESSILLGSKEDILVPITLDLRDLPLEATGIVCGVAGRLADATLGQNSIDQLGRSTASLLSDYDSSGSHRRKSSSTDFMSYHHHLSPDLDASLDAVEISFLSTARAGTVIVGERELERAVDALEAASHEPENDED